MPKVLATSQARFEAAEFLIVDGAAGLDSAIAAVWGGVPNQIPEVSIEQVLAWNPQVVVTIDRDFD